MSAPLRRKAKKRFVTFTLTVEAQEMIVQYQADWMPDMGHFEFSSPHEPPRRLLMQDALQRHRQGARTFGIVERLGPRAAELPGGFARVRA